MNLDLNFSLMVPEFLLFGATLLVLMVDALTARPEEGAEARVPGAVGWIAILGSLGAAGWSLCMAWGHESLGTSFGGLFVVDSFTQYVKAVVGLGAGLSLLLSEPWLRRHKVGAGAAHSLLLMSTTGMMYMVSAGDLVMLFMGLEIMSIPIYCLAGALRWDSRSVESAVKYLVLGSFATAILLFGFVLLYGFTGLSTGQGTTELVAIQAAVLGAENLPTYASLGGLFVLVGLLFKVSAAPFHMWTPDVYEGAPTPYTAYMSVAVKATAIAVLVRLFGPSMLEAFGLRPLLWAVAAITMIVGNVAALVQDNVKRMLAYSSIAHGGYLLVGVLVGTAEAQTGILYYILAYTAANIAAFGALILLGRQGVEVERFDDLAGLGPRFPMVSAVLSLSMLSLVGIPPLAGFVGKFVLFKAAVAEGFVVLTVIALLTSAVSFAYYLRPLVALFMRPATGPSWTPEAMGLRGAMVLALCTAAIVGLGVFMERTLHWVGSSVLAAAG